MIRVNTIYFDFSELDRPSDLDLNIWLKTLGLKNGEILTIQYNNQLRNVLVKLKSDRLVDEFLSKTGPTTTFHYDGHNYKIPTGNNVSKYKIVHVKYIPLEADLQTLLEKIGEYGTVGEHKREHKDYTKQGGFEYETEVISIQVWLQKEIPSYIKLGEYQANVWYLGQQQTCAKCNATDHRARECPQNRPRRWETQPAAAQEEKPQVETPEAAVSEDSQSEKMDDEETEKADEEEEEEEEENGWTSPKNPAPAAIVITSPNQLPEPITNRYLVHQPRPIPLERQKDPEDLAPNQRGTGTARSPKSSHQRRRSKDSIDEEKRIERGGSTDRKRKETEEKGEEKNSEKVQKKNTPEKNNEEINEGAETATSEMPVPFNTMSSVQRIVKDLHAKHSSSNKQQQTQRTEPNTKGSGEASGSLHGAS